MPVNILVNTKMNKTYIFLQYNGKVKYGRNYLPISFSLLHVNKKNLTSLSPLKLNFAT